MEWRALSRDTARRLEAVGLKGDDILYGAALAPTFFRAQQQSRHGPSERFVE